MVRLVERLMTVDKVDIVLSPWGTGPNLQAAPTFAKYGYPQIMGTAGSDKIEELVQRFPTMFWFLGKPDEQIKALVDLLADLKKQGPDQRHGGRVRRAAPVRLGVQRHRSSRRWTSAGFKIVYETTYPLGVADLSRADQGGQGGQPRQP